MKIPSQCRMVAYPMMHLWRGTRYYVTIIDDMDTGIAIPLVLDAPDFVAMALSGHDLVKYGTAKAHEVVNQMRAIVGEVKLLTV
jgi:hypothetical protein